MNKFESFKMMEIERESIHNAEYNPRKITESAQKKLRKKIKEDGIVMPIVVNSRTNNIVAGHQRIEILDQLHKNKNYKINASIIDVDEKKEIELNTFLNNQSAMGEWDVDALMNIKEEFPDINFIDDMGFDKLDLDYMFSTSNKNPTEIDNLFNETKEQKKILSDIEKIQQSDNMRQSKKDFREKKKTLDDSGQSDYIENNDYIITFVFNTNQEKQNFMIKIGKPNKEKFLKATVLHDVLQDKYKF